MAAGDRLLDSSGNVILDASGNVQLSNGTGDGCCCGECLASSSCGSSLPTSITLTFSSGTAVCRQNMSIPTASVRLLDDISGTFTLNYEGPTYPHNYSDRPGYSGTVEWYSCPHPGTVTLAGFGTGTGVCDGPENDVEYSYVVEASIDGFSGTTTYLHVYIHLYLPGDYNRLFCVYAHSFQGCFKNSGTDLLTLTNSVESGLHITAYDSLLDDSTVSVSGTWAC